MKTTESSDSNSVEDASVHPPRAIAVTIICLSSLSVRQPHETVRENGDGDQDRPKIFIHSSRSVKPMRYGQNPNQVLAPPLR